VSAEKSEVSGAATKRMPSLGKPPKTTTFAAVSAELTWLTVAVVVNPTRSRVREVERPNSGWGEKSLGLSRGAKKSGIWLFAKSLFGPLRPFKTTWTVPVKTGLVEE
jgi:hypothetical protein